MTQRERRKRTLKTTARITTVILWGESNRRRWWCSLHVYFHADWTASSSCYKTPHALTAEAITCWIRNCPYISPLLLLKKVSLFLSSWFHRARVVSISVAHFLSIFMPLCVGVCVQAPKRLSSCVGVRWRIAQPRLDGTTPISVSKWRGRSNKITLPSSSSSLVKCVCVYGIAHKSFKNAICLVSRG